MFKSQFCKIRMTDFNNQAVHGHLIILNKYTDLGGKQNYFLSPPHPPHQLSPQQHCATPRLPMLPVAAERGGMLIS